jgi:hypothetical protein
MKILNKIKNLFKKSGKLSVNDNSIITSPIGEVHYFDFKYEEPTSTPTKIAAQQIGLDLVELKYDPNIVMTSGYIDFKEDIKLTPEEILFQMKKLKDLLKKF